MQRALSRQLLFRTLKTSNFNSKSFSTAKNIFKVENPYTLETYCEYEYKSHAELQTTVKETYDTYKKWREVPLAERIEVVKKSAEYFSKNQDAIAKDITCQMGKPLAQSIGELKGYQNVVKKLTEIAPEALAEKVVKENQQGLLKYIREPVGVCAIFSPWNYPVMTCANLVIASILAGNSVVIKHSPFTPLIGKHFEESFKHAGIENLVRDLMIVPEDAVKLYKMPEVGFVSFTGSTETGKSVQDEICDHRFLNYTLELGGNDAAYIAEDADVEYAAREVITAAMYNAGQSCNGIGRIFVHKSIYDDFLEKATSYAAAYQMGDPMKSDTTLGPLALPDKQEAIKQLIEEAAMQGGRITIGGLPTTDSEGKGRFFEPTIVADAQNDMHIMLVETFGPVVGVGPTEGDEEVIKLINDDQYGLTSAIFTKNKDRIMSLASKLNVGTVYANRAMHVEPHLPWSGRKNSGVGASLSELGFHAVTRPKSYNMKFFA